MTLSPFHPIALAGFRNGLLPISAILILLLLCFDQGSGQNLRSFTLSADNDGFVFWIAPHDRSDWYYTHGLRAEMVLAWAPRLARVLGGEPSEVCDPKPGLDPCVLTRLTLGQAIYTPEMLFSTSPPVGDRPYAGWLFSEASVAEVSEKGITSLGIQVGVTGEPSLAGPVHRWFHKSLGKHEPQGWDHQIPFELALAVDYQVKRALPLTDRAGPTSLHLEPHGGVTLGTLRTGATAGLSLRAGWNAGPSSDWTGPSGDAGFIFLSVGAEGEMVLRDLFLDGSTWGSSAKADRIPLLARLEGRIQAGLGKIAVEFAATGSTAQFSGQKEPHTIGTIRILVYP